MWYFNVLKFPFLPRIVLPHVIEQWHVLIKYEENTETIEESGKEAAET